MKRAAMFAMSAAVLAMTNACAPRETLRTVSDFCQNDSEVRFSLAPGANADDPGNQFDTDETANALIEHNAVHRRLCQAKAAR